MDEFILSMAICAVVYGGMIIFLARYRPELLEALNIKPRLGLLAVMAGLGLLVFQLLSAP